MQTPEWLLQHRSCERVACTAFMYTHTTSNAHTVSSAVYNMFERCLSKTLSPLWYASVLFQMNLLLKEYLSSGDCREVNKQRTCLFLISSVFTVLSPLSQRLIVVSTSLKSHTSTMSWCTRYVYTAYSVCVCVCVCVCACVRACVQGWQCQLDRRGEGLGIPRRSSPISNQLYWSNTLCNYECVSHCVWVNWE